MSDSFADLWSSSAPSKPQPQKLGTASTITSRRPQQDVFTLLSSARSSNPSSRSITPSSLQRVSTPKQASSANGGGDAFSGLLSGSLAASNNTPMTIAERAAQAERQKLEDLRRHHAVKNQASLGNWAGLDSLANSSSPAPSKPSRVLSNPDSLLGDEDWGFGSAPRSKPKPPIKNSEKVASISIDNYGDGWGLDDFGAPASRTSSQSKSRPQASKPTSILDLDELSSPPSSSSKLMSLPAVRVDSPGDFDFGNREDALLDNESDDEEDILGALSKPVESTNYPKHPSPPNQKHSSSSSSSNNTPRRTDANGPYRSTSPPPHVLGKLVEMGFSIQQARAALASTSTGLDMEAALDTLLAEKAVTSFPSSSPLPSTGPASLPQSPDYDSQSQRSATLLIEGRTRSSSSSISQPGERNIQEQADKLLAQASEIGLSVLSKASSLWKEGRGRVQKVYEDRAAVSSVGPQSVRDGRPKWMQETAARGDADDAHDDDGWRDRNGDTDRGRGLYDEVLPSRPSKTAVKPRKSYAADTQPPSRTQTPDLFSTDQPIAAYVSPYRRVKPANQAAPPQQPQLPLRPRARTRVPSPIRPTPRLNLVSASASTIARSAQHKSAGSAKFKLGQYTDAESAYTAGITCLPSGHLLLVPLYNNRALARLRTGDHAGAVEDVGRVVEIVGEGYHPAREEVVRGEEYVGGEEGGVDLGEGLVKALKRRAEAWEGRERWVEAGKDWESLAGKEWVRSAVKNEAVRGAGRCRRMAVQAQSTDRRPEDLNPKPKPKFKPKPRPTAVVSAGPSQALENLRNVNNAAEREDQARYELKDVVDAKLGAWKGGKETNIRALLGSLDVVLWPELGLKKVGMADLVSEKQVKVQYTRTIGRLHPDKLNASNTTVEQRMIANGVFGVLNEAWNAFKP